MIGHQAKKEQEEQEEQVEEQEEEEEPAPVTLAKPLPSPCIDCLSGSAGTVRFVAAIL